jgi:hypothetical protein
MVLDRRSNPRESVMLPIALAGGGTGMARNLSVGGLYFTVPTGTPVQPWLRLEYKAPSAGMTFSAVGQVVRIEPGRYEDGVALRLLASKLTPIR